MATQHDIPKAATDTTGDHVRPHYDGCPECGSRWNIPTRTCPDHRGSLPGCLSTYRCRHCRHEWSCAWACDGMG